LIKFDYTTKEDVEARSQ